MSDDKDDKDGDKKDYFRQHVRLLASFCSKLSQQIYKSDLRYSEPFGIGALYVTNDRVCQHVELSDNADNWAAVEMFIVREAVKQAGQESTDKIDRATNTVVSIQQYLDDTETPDAISSLIHDFMPSLTPKEQSQVQAVLVAVINNMRKNQTQTAESS